MEKKIIVTPEAPLPIGPYSQAVMIGNTLYVSGQIPLDANSGQVLKDTIEAETQKSMQNIGVILKAAGMDYANIVKTTIFLTDMDQFSRVNGVYATFFTEAFPARETVEVSRLPRDANVEISVVAVK